MKNQDEVPEGTEVINLHERIRLNPIYQDPSNFTVLGATTFPVKLGCYGCAREFSTIEKLHAHICTKRPKKTRNGTNSNPSTSAAMAARSSFLRNGLMNNDPSQFMYPLGNPTLRPSTITRPKMLEYRPQTEPTDLTMRIDQDGTTGKRKRAEGEGMLSSYGMHVHLQTCICPSCGSPQPNFHSFIRHMDNHITRLNNHLIVCPACGESSETVEAYSSHCFDHYIVQSTGYCCATCRILFRTEEESVSHFQENHVISLFRCIVCGDVLENNMALQYHYVRHHKAYCTHSSCKLCPHLVFQDRMAVQFHISMVHFKQCFRNQNAIEPDQTYAPDNNIYHQTPQALSASSLTQPLPQQSSLSSGCLYPKLDSSEDRFPRTPPKSLTCDICNLTDISSEAELNSHKKLQHSKSKARSHSLQCAYCKETSKSRSELETHMKSHQGVYGKGKHKCNICDAIFPSSVTLADHKLAHCKIIEGSICGQCKGGIKDEQSFYDHQLLHNTSPSKTNSQIGFPANCVICSQTLQNTIELNNHANFHLKHLVRRHICTICKEAYDAPKYNGEQKKDILKHLRSVCPICVTEEEKRFAGLRDPESNSPGGKRSRYDLENGQGTSSNEKNNLECRSCKQVFTSPAKLQTHLIEHNFVGMNQYSCYICSSVFTAADGLRNHILGHGVQNKPYECPFCELKFFFRTELDNHIVIHDSQSTTNSISLMDKNSLADTKESNKYETCMYCRNVFSKNSFFLDHLKNCSARIEMTNEVDEDNKIKQENVDPADFNNTK